MKMTQNRILIFLITLILGCSLEKRVHEYAVLPDVPNLGSKLADFLDKNDHFDLLRPDSFEYFNPPIKPNNNKLNNKELLLYYKPSYVVLGTSTANSSKYFDSISYVFSKGYLISICMYVEKEKRYPLLLAITDSTTANSKQIDDGISDMYEYNDLTIFVDKYPEGKSTISLYHNKNYRLLAPTI